MYSSLLGPIFYFYIYVSSSVLSYCSIKHDDDDDDNIYRPDALPDTQPSILVQLMHSVPHFLVLHFQRSS